ncbi:hypothetical protein [Aliiglaciecola litoralis]|uniref:Secreted protein n=1 Tax=Aliiglaciecola litoralis TaxID=582857 RepID=A0ABN1LQB8_9ALTE
MNRKLKASVSVFGSALFAVLVMAQTQFASGDGFCANVEQVAFNASFPVSHPMNRCAFNKPETGVSWTKWFSGRSPSFQFHYLDLLELLSRTTEDSNDHRSGNQ